MAGRIMVAAVICVVALPCAAFAQDAHQGRAVSFELDEEKLEIEADIPSVDLILSFKELQERNRAVKVNFLQEIVESAKEEPF